MPKHVNYAGTQLYVASSTWVLKLGWFESTRLTALAMAPSTLRAAAKARESQRRPNLQFRVFNGLDK